MKSVGRGEIGLACAGGVVEGAFYEIGALCALEDCIEGLSFHDLGVYVGVSSGALLASCLSNGISVRELSKAVVGESDFTELNIDPKILFSPAWDDYLKSVKRIPPKVAGLLKNFISAPTDLSLMGLLAELGTLMPAGMFSNKALEKYLSDVFSRPGRTNDFRKLSVSLRIVAVALDNAALVVFGEPQNETVSISKAVQASTALPGLYGPVLIDGVHYIDGVARRTVHASKALEAGVGLLFAINPIIPVTVGQDEPPSVQSHLADEGLLAVLSQSLRTLVYSRMQTGFKKYEHLFPGTDIVRIEPQFEDQNIFFSNIFSFSNRQEICEHAFQTTREFLRVNYDEIGSQLSRHGLNLLRDKVFDKSLSLYRQKEDSVQETMSQAMKVLNTLDHALCSIESQL